MWTFIFEIQGRGFASQIEKPGKTLSWNPTSDIKGCLMSTVWQDINTTHISKNNEVIQMKWNKLLKGKWNKQKWSIQLVKTSSLSMIFFLYKVPSLSSII